MREITFRGKREKTGEWVDGYLIKRDEPFLHDIVVPKRWQKTLCVCEL